jgi:hypothetical protein
VFSHSSLRRHRPIPTYLFLARYVLHFKQSLSATAPLVTELRTRPSPKRRLARLERHLPRTDRVQCKRYLRVVYHLCVLNRFSARGEILCGPKSRKLLHSTFELSTCLCSASPAFFPHLRMAFYLRPRRVGIRREKNPALNKFYIGNSFKALR